MQGVARQILTPTAASLAVTSQGTIIALNNTTAVVEYCAHLCIFSVGIRNWFYQVALPPHSTDLAMKECIAYGLQWYGRRHL